MADFRKWLFALAVVALLAGLTVPASAQSSVTCSLQTATDNLVRAEGYTELVGDVVVACTGGTPTQPGYPVPPINIQLYLSQNVTSKITAVVGNTNGSTGGTASFLEALLIIDEPNSPLTLATAGTQLLNCGNSGAPDNSVALGPGVCTIYAPATVGNSSPNTYNGTSGHPNVFQGREALSGTNSIVFTGVPFDPPGTTTRILRFTNIRVNANGLGVTSPNQQSPITMGIASSGNASLQLSFQSLAVATVEQGLTTSTASSKTNYAQCVNENKSLLTASPVPAYSTTYAAPTVRFSEGFSSSWKTKNLVQVEYNGGESGYYYSGNNGGYISYGPEDWNQNVPGVSYNTESGFESSTNAVTPSPNPPYGYQNFGNTGLTTVSGGAAFYNAYTNTGFTNVGTATQGTRLAVSLANVPNGLNLYVAPVIFLYRQGYAYTLGPNANDTHATGVMVLTNTATDGSGAYSPPSGLANPVAAANEPMQQVSVTNGAALVVYEVLDCDPIANEYADVPFTVAYASALNSNAPIGLPQPQVTTWQGGFAPFESTSAAAQWSASLPNPRFVFTGTSANLFGITKCSCNLLFPYVTQAPGYDTGIAIANTTSDPYGTTNQPGGVEFWYYGSLSNGGAAPGTQCTNTASPGTCPGTTVVNAGQVLTYTLYNGSPTWGLDNRGIGFTGYMIAQTQFQYCHAFAFIGGLGGGPAVNSSTNGLSEGYLALILDLGTFNRGSTQGESLGN